jgi:hypothetical protein
MYYRYMSEETMLRFYHEYLVGLAFVSGRPFKLPKSLTNLTKSNPGERKMLHALVKKLGKNEITQKRTFNKFIDVCTVLYDENSFHLRTFLDDFDKIMVKFKNYDQMFKEEGNSIEKSFSEIEEYCIINNIRGKQDLMNGHPPPIVKLWKQKKIDDYAFAFIFDVAGQKYI